MTRRILGLALAGLLVAGTPALAQDPADAPPHDRPGPAADRVLFNSFFVDRAPLDITAGNMDLYLFGLKVAAAIDLRDQPGVRLIDAPATSLSLILNPAPAPEGRLNPFAIPEIRRAMHHLIDREFIARDIYRGFGAPMTTHMGPFDPDFLTVYDIDRGSVLTYDPELGRQIVADAMTAAGAERPNGVWAYNGQPVRIRLIARVEDERREIGDLVRAELEAAGFEVAISYEQFAPAIQRVYSTDPAALEWHIYTEGWGRSAPQRYDVGAVNSFNAPWVGNMPGWREQGFWQYEDAEMDALGQTLFRGEFASHEERDEIYRDMTARGLDASVRIWLATVVNSFPADGDLAGVTRDIVAGPRSPWMLREAYVPGSDTVRVGHQWVWTERTTWNPVGGFGDVYSVDIWRNLSDPPLWNHPFTGIPQPFRADYEVETAGPDGTLPVPADAVLWDAEADRWVPVGTGTTAVSRVTFDYARYLDARWHHGQPIELADAVYAIAQGFDLSYDPDKARIETAIAVTSRPYLETFRGFRITDDDRLEVYVDFWHFDADHIASYASPVSFAMPWEVLAAMDELVFGERRAAYSDTAAARQNVPWLSLVMRRDAGLVERTLRRLSREGHVPAGVFEIGGRTLVDADAAVARYAAAGDWYASHDHLVISNGPFMLNRFDPPAQFAELLAFRDEGYPFKPGDRLLGEPPELAIEDVTASPITAGQAAEVDVRVSGPGGLALRYLLLDPATGSVVATGEAEATDADGGFRVSLDESVTADLFPGLVRLFLAASSDDLALVSERQLELEVGF
jgi:peptide/nickel transport system substrate-binding protein